MQPLDESIQNQTGTELTEQDIDELVEIVSGEIEEQPQQETRCKVCDNILTKHDPIDKTVLLIDFNNEDHKPIYGDFYLCRGCIYRIAGMIDVMLQD